MQFLVGPPIWVWPLFALLLFLGVKATRARTAPILLIYCLPLLGLISLRGISTLPMAEIAWVCFAGGYSVGAAYAYKLQGKWLLGIDGSRASLAGEWVTLTAMMTLFLMNFAGGTVQATNPELFASVGFTVVYAVSIALASGSFLGRAYKVMRSK